jgi:hypothetical protein
VQLISATPDEPVGFAAVTSIVCAVVDQLVWLGPLENETVGGVESIWIV